MGYRIDKSEDGVDVTVVMSGSFTYRNHAVFENIITELQKMPKDGNLIFDMNQVAFVDSSILGVFSLIGEKASQPEKNIAVSLRGVNGGVRSAMLNAGFDKLFTLY